MEHRMRVCASVIITFALIAFLRVPLPAQAVKMTERFTASTMNMASRETLKIDVLRWSADVDRDGLTAAIGQSEDACLKALQAAPTVGYIWPPGSLGYSLHYAFRAAMPDGSERVVLATDRRLGEWNKNGWKLNPPISATNTEFTVIELRVSRAGLGEGKMSLATRVVADPESKTIALDDYKSAPVLLTGVRRVGAATAAKGTTGR